MLNIPFRIRGRNRGASTVGVSVWAAFPTNSGARSVTPTLPIRSAQEPVDIVVFHHPAFQEPCFLRVPASSETQLPTADVLALYRQRMHIELTFRAWKTHVGLHGLRLEAGPALRLGRWLLALSTAYILAVLLGSGDSRHGYTPPCESPSLAA
jgi:hypothetical protein